MTHSIDDILSFDSLNLTPYEIRGAKSGINNARSTGPVFVNGTYIPSVSSIAGSGTFTMDSSIVTGVTFPFYPSFTTDQLKVMDIMTSGGSTFLVSKIDDPTTIELDQTASTTGTFPIQFSLTQREYVVEPDSSNITITGIAGFTKDSTDVYGLSTSWTTQLASGDFIRQDSSQQFYRIFDVPANNHLRLVGNYTGDTIQNTYTAKYWKIGREKIQYAKNGITFDNQGGRWKYDHTTASNLPTSTSFLGLADGINLRFTNSLNSSLPDLMDIATTVNQSLSRSTQYDTFQYSLPVVPFPEETLEIFINGIKKDRFPEGNQDYVVNYSQNPVYTPPPPPALRQVANLMFLKGISNVNSPTSATQTGQMSVTDSSGNAITGIMPGSETVLINGSPQTPTRDYILEPNTGTIEVINSTLNEQLVKYVGVNYSDTIDYGFSILLNGKKQKISFPPQPTDDIIFQTQTGRFKPQNQDHPGPGDTYEIHYMVETTPIQNETLSGSVGQTNLNTLFYPIKQGSMLLVKGGNFLTEGEDFFVSYLTGQILLTDPLVAPNSIVATYTPLSKQINQMTFDNGQSFCTVVDSRLIVKSFNFQFSLLNAALPVDSITVLRIYNETRNKEYDLTGLTAANGMIILASNATNVAIGLNLPDVVVIDYKFQNESTEYFPIVVNYMNLISGSRVFYFENQNLTSAIIPGSSVNIQFPDSATQFFFVVSDSTNDSIGTKVTLESTIPEDIVNPNIFISDSSVSFPFVTFQANPITTGSMDVIYQNINISNIFRPETLLKIRSDVYQVSSASFESNQTSIKLTSQVTADYTDITTLLNIKYSDIPVYLEGETILTPVSPAVTLINQIGFIMNNGNDEVLQVISDSTALTINGNEFLYVSNPTLADLSSSINAANISALSLLTYVPGWRSDKITSQSFSVFKDSNTSLLVSDALRYKNGDLSVFADTTNFSIADGGQISLTNPLAQFDRYELDYMGQRFLGLDQVTYSLKYFTILPAKSSVVASFQYNNLDQFYIQVLDERDFLDTVTKPRMQDEATQLNGNVGQGGQIIVDSEGSNTDGGISGDEFRRQDAAIECTIFKAIYDFYQDRLKSYGDEMEAGLGPRLFNNDGTFSEVQQTAAFKTVNRIFPQSDYTNFEPMKVNPITGYFIAQGAGFFQNHPGVESLGSEWLKEFAPNDFIGRTDSTRLYKILAVNSDTSVALTEPFHEKSTTNPIGDQYTASTRFPIYDDDGYLGPKIVGLKSGNFGLSDNNVFDCYIDGSYSPYTFEELPGLPLFPIPLNLIFPLSGLSASEVVSRLNVNIPGLLATEENVLDPTTTLGSRSTIVLRTEAPTNTLALGTGAAVSKILGFNGATTGTVIGNRRMTDRRYELELDTTEAGYVNTEASLLSSMSSQFNKLNRINFTTALSTAITNELTIVPQEIPFIQTAITASGVLADETSFSTFTDSSTSHKNAIDFLNSTFTAFAYDSLLIPGWQGKVNPVNWSLDLTQDSQIIHGKDPVGIGVPIILPGDTTISGQSQFILQVPAGNDIRFLNPNLPLPPPFDVLTGPSVVFENNSQPVSGTWTGWDFSPGIDGSYSVNNQITFTMNLIPALQIDRTSSISNAKFTTNATSLILNWNVGATPFDATIVYGSQSVLDVKNAINAIPGFTATDYITDYAASFRLVTLGAINPTAFLYQGLRDCVVSYQTISEALLTPRIAQTTDRSSSLLSRVNYLPVRQTQIKSDMTSEEILRTSTGDPGDLYIWANNRFNRRQGCYAKLNQIQQQMASNQSALNINRLFM